MPSKKKKYNSRFPPARIKKIMQTDEDVGKVAAPVPVLISKALEIFVKSLITKANEQTQARNAKTMTTAHIKQGILNESKFDFLKDLVQDIPDITADDEEGATGSEVKPKQSRQRRIQNCKTNTRSSSSGESTAEADSDISDDEDSNDKLTMKTSQQSVHGAATASAPSASCYSLPHAMPIPTLPTMPQMPQLPMIPQQPSFIPQMYMPPPSSSAIGSLQSSSNNNDNDDDEDYDS
ncbi:dr1-associated corepressor-like [Ptychodera flava]|uniref:dr1-associated corepressor-like n=1 Tax=Ptychodera flava TaxID=63121 RepID=UPI00396AA946